MKRLTLSNSRLGLFVECPRCFWLDLNAGIKRPDTIFPSLPGGLDAQFKRYFDQFRASGDVPPEVKGKLPGRLLSDVGTINRWRDWRRGIRYTPPWADCELMGALDECLVDEAGFYYPLDYKTRGYAPKADTHEYYQDQMNLYTLLLESNGNQRCTHLSLRTSIPYACHREATSPLVCHCEGRSPSLGSAQGRPASTGLRAGCAISLKFPLCLKGSHLQKPLDLGPTRQ